MARVKQAVQIVQMTIDKMSWRDDYFVIVGMMEMAVRLDRMTVEERRELMAKLEDKYETLED